MYYKGTEDDWKKISIGSYNDPIRNATIHYYDDTPYDGSLFYQVNNGEVTITDCSESATVVNIPSVIDGYPVTSIGDGAFSGCSSLKKLTIPKSVVEIENNNFKGGYLTDIYYEGTKDDWDKIEINSDIENVKIHYADEKCNLLLNSNNGSTSVYINGVMQNSPYKIYKGDTVKFTANGNEGYNFIGFYATGDNGMTLLSKNTEYEFVADDNINIIASFTKNTSEKANVTTAVRYGLDYEKTESEHNIGDIVSLNAEQYNKDGYWFDGYILKAGGTSKKVSQKNYSFVVTEDTGIDVLFRNDSEKGKYLVPELKLETRNDNLRRDYAQKSTVKVTNTSNQTIYYYLQAENSYDDIYLNFVDAGSDLHPVTIAPGKTQKINLSIFLQNAKEGFYSIPIKAYVKYDGEFYENANANVEFNCYEPKFDISFKTETIESSTLTTTYSVTNNGDDITDFTLTLNGVAADYVRFETSYENYPLKSGETIKVNLIPDLASMKYDENYAFGGKLIGTSGKNSAEYDISFDTNGAEITAIEAYRLALYQNNNPYYDMVQTAYSASTDNLTKDNWQNHFGEDGSFTTLTESSFEYGNGNNAQIDTIIRVTPSTGKIDGGIEYSTQENSSNGEITGAIRVNLEDSESLKLLSDLLGDIGDTFDIHKQVEEFGKKYEDITGLDLTITTKITDSLLSKLIKEGKEYDDNFKFFIDAVNGVKNAANFASDVTDVLSVWGNPNISENDKKAYSALAIAEFALKGISFPGSDFFTSGYGTATGIIDKMFKTAIGIGDLSGYSNSALTQYMTSLAKGTQCTNAGRVTSNVKKMGWFEKGLRAYMGAYQIYQRLGDGASADEFLGIENSYNSKKSLKSSNNNDVSLVFMTGRMASGDGKYTNRTDTKFSVSVNEKYVGDVKNNGLTEMFTVGLITDAFHDGINTVTRRYNTNPGSHFVTAETEYSFYIPDNAEIAYIGTPDEYETIKALPDFAVYPENIYVSTENGETLDAVDGEKCTIAANIYNRGQVGGWTDVIFETGGEEIYRVQNQYVKPFSEVKLVTPWTADMDSSDITVHLENKTCYVDENKTDNNSASIKINVREWQEPIINEPEQTEFVLADGDDVYVTFAVKNYDDITSVIAYIDGEKYIGEIAKTEIDGKMNFIINPKNLTVGEHQITLDIKYNSADGEKELTKIEQISIRKHDCETDRHSLIHIEKVSPTDDHKGCIEHWECRNCGKLFADKNAETELTEDDIIVLTQSYIKGDINGDGCVNNKDATQILRYFANWNLTELVEEALDTNGDGVISNKDATHLLRYFANWNVELH